MARPKKQNVSYFPMYCQSSKTVQILENKYGNDGFAFFFKLLQVLGNENFHYYDCRNEIDFEFLAGKMGFSSEKLRQMLENLRDWGKIDRELWENKIIWCQGFVDTLADAYKERTTELPTITDCRRETGVLSFLKEENNSFQEENKYLPEEKERKPPTNAQIKEKESKLKEIKINNTNYDDIQFPEEQKIESIKSIMSEEDKSSSSSLVTLKRFLLGEGLLGTDIITPDSLKNLPERIIDSISITYTSLQKKTLNNTKYARVVKKALIGQSKENWNLREVIDDVSNHAHSELLKLISKYELKKIEIEKKEIEEAAEERKRDLMLTFRTLPKSIQAEIENSAIDIVSRRSGGMRFNPGNPIVRSEIVEIIEREGYQKQRMEEAIDV